MTNDIDTAPVVYDVRPRYPGAHLLEVTCRIANPAADGQRFSLPTWIPGSYMIRDYARHVVSVTAEADGEPVPLRKIDKSTWRVGRVAGPLLIRSLVYANDLSVRGAFVDREHAFLNGVCLFFRVHGFEHDRCVVHLAAPDHAPDWSVATALERLTGAEPEFGAFVADDYDQLIDCPVLMGELTFGRFEVEGAEHVLAMAGRHEADVTQLERDMARICRQHAGLFGGTVPFRRYVFLLTVLNAGYGGLEHADCCALVCSRADLPRAGESAVTEKYRGFLGLVSHEYFHLWNVKRIRPVEFVAAGLDAEVVTRQLWVFEGITSYYDDLGVLRSGLIGGQDYLELLGRTLTGVYRAGGRRYQTLEDASFDAWIKFYRPDENAPNALVSYYRKGAMVALALDLELRLRTRGRLSLDDVMLALWQRYGSPASHGLSEDGFEEFVEELTGLDLAEFFRQSLRTTVDPPVGILLAQFGIRLHMRAADSDNDPGGKPAGRKGPPRPWFGFTTRVDQGRLMIRHVASRGAAADAGLSANDELVSVDGLRATPESWPEVQTRVRVGEPVELCVFRRDELHRYIIEPDAPPRDTCYLTLEADVDAAVERRRREWLGA